MFIDIVRAAIITLIVISTLNSRVSVCFHWLPMFVDIFCAVISTLNSRVSVLFFTLPIFVDIVCATISTLITPCNLTCFKYFVLTFLAGCTIFVLYPYIILFVFVTVFGWWCLFGCISLLPSCAMFTVVLFILHFQWQGRHFMLCRFGEFFLVFVGL